MGVTETASQVRGFQTSFFLRRRLDALVKIQGGSNQDL